MLKHLHKILLIGCLICSISLSNAYAQEDKPIEVVNQVTQTTTTVNVKDIDIEPLNTKEIKKDVVPDVKKETKKVASYFFLAVVLLAFLVLSIYLAIFLRTRYLKAFANELDEFSDKLELGVPSNKEEALKSFLNRTK